MYIYIYIVDVSLVIKKHRGNISQCKCKVRYILITLFSLKKINSFNQRTISFVESFEQFFLLSFATRKNNKFYLTIFKKERLTRENTIIDCVAIVFIFNAFISISFI